MEPAEPDRRIPASARLRLRAGEFATPRRGSPRIRRAAALMFVLAWILLPGVALMFVDADQRLSGTVGLLLFAYLAVLTVLMVKVIRRR